MKLFDAAATLSAKGAEIQTDALASEIDADPAFVGKYNSFSPKQLKTIH